VLRRAGVLLHSTSLPSPFGVGDLGPDASRFLTFLSEAGMALWQVLPLGPPGYGGSPYNAESSFALNELLISPHLLVESGLLAESDIASPPDADPHHVDFGAAGAYKDALLRRAHAGFASAAAPAEFEAFCAGSAAWLDDFALYRALKAHHGHAAWLDWPEEVRLRDPGRMATMRNELAAEIHFQHFVQWVAETQWQALKQQAGERGIAIVGDVPMFPALDSADVWADQWLFKLDASGRPTVAAGVPPDYFSKTGQLWGNPHYDWPKHRDTGYAWWKARFDWTFRRVDMVRIDHFRGFAAAWEVPAGSKTAIGGTWADGPGIDIFERLGLLGQSRIIAEDLGLITDDVRELLDATGFPGMKVLHFAFDSGPDNAYLPANHIPNSVAYTGTHDNDTTQGWIDSLDRKGRSAVLKALGNPGGPLLDALIEAAMGSVADTAIIPMQDVLALGSEARMNTPAEPHGNWSWRFSWDQLDPARVEWLNAVVGTSGRTV
jgi:4-alpha-glucanotransferase